MSDPPSPEEDGMKDEREERGRDDGTTVRRDGRREERAEVWRREG